MHWHERRVARPLPPGAFGAPSMRADYSADVAPLNIGNSHVIAAEGVPALYPPPVRLTGSAEFSADLHLRKIAGTASRYGHHGHTLSSIRQSPAWHKFPSRTPR